MTTFVAVTTKPCVICERKSVITMPAEALRRWQAGEFIQVAWPDSTPDERELLMTGTHPDCWDALIPEDEEEE